MMNIFFIFSLSVFTVGIIIYPLFFEKLRKYELSEEQVQDFSQEDTLLGALSELEEDYQFGRISQKDYQHLKLYFQRRYLQIKKASKDA